MIFRRKFPDLFLNRLAQRLNSRYGRSMRREPARLASPPSGARPVRHYATGPLEITHGHKPHSAKQLRRR